MLHSTNFPEFASPTSHKNVGKIISLERQMNNPNFDQIDMQQDGTKICLLFPKKEQHEEDIRKEVKCILSCALQEQLRKNA